MRARQVAVGGVFGTSLAVAFPAPVLAGSLLIYGHCGDVTWTALTDTRNTPVLGIQTDATVFSAVHYVLNAAAGATTATRTFASGNAGLLIAEFANWNHWTASGLEKTHGATGFSTTPSSGAVTTIWPTQLLIGFCGFEQAGDPFVPDSAWQDEVAQSFAGGTGELMSRYTTTAGAFTAQGTTTATPNWSQNLLTFKVDPLPQPGYGSRPVVLTPRVAKQQRVGD